MCVSGRAGEGVSGVGGVGVQLCVPWLLAPKGLRRRASRVRQRQSRRTTGVCGGQANQTGQRPAVQIHADGGSRAVVMAGRRGWDGWVRRVDSLWPREREEAGSAEEGKEGGRARTTLFASSITLTQAKNIRAESHTALKAPCRAMGQRGTPLPMLLTPKSLLRASHTGYMPVWCDPFDSKLHLLPASPSTPVSTSLPLRAWGPRLRVRAALWEWASAAMPRSVPHHWQASGRSTANHCDETGTARLDADTMNQPSNSILFGAGLSPERR